MSDDNVKGASAAFCTFTPFRTRFDRWLHWVVLKSAPVETDTVRLQRFLHYMCFASVSPRALRRAGVAARGRAGAMLFMSAYNGDAEPYFRGFNQNLAEHMNNLWRGCEGWRGARVFEYLARFIEDYRRRSGFYFNAYPDTSANLRVALRLRGALDELLAVAHDEPQRFLEEYRRAARLAWGAPDRPGRAA